MTFDISFCRDCNLLVCRGTGEVTSREVLDALRGAFSDPLFRPGLDRLTVFDSMASLADLDKIDLERIRGVIRAAEASEKDGLALVPRFKSAFVSANAANRMIVELYRAMWESDSGSAAQFQAFSTVAEALDWLGRARDVEKIWPDIAGAPVEGLRSAR